MCKGGEVRAVYLLDGNTPLHEWKYPLSEHPKIVADEFGFEYKDREEPVENLTTWVFEEGTYKPAAKLTKEKQYSIITDYLGTPVQMYDGGGALSWDCSLDIYEKVNTFTGRSLNKCPFRYQGQYEDEETGLYYNRFRYYDPSSGVYLSQDPIGLNGGNPTLYGYVKDVNSWVDVFGLDCGKVKPLKKGDKVYRVYGGDSKAGGASWAKVSPNKYKNYRNSAGLPSGKESGVTNTGQFVIEGTVKDPSKVVKSRKAIPLDGNKGGIDEFIIPNWENNGAIEMTRVSGVNPEF